MESLPGGVRQVAERVHRRWTELQPSTKVVMAIIGVNTGVFMLWRVPLLRVRPEAYMPLLSLWLQLAGTVSGLLSASLLWRTKLACLCLTCSAACWRCG